MVDWRDSALAQLANPAANVHVPVLDPNDTVTSPASALGSNKWAYMADLMAAALPGARILRPSGGDDTTQLVNALASAQSVMLAPGAWALEPGAVVVGLGQYLILPGKQACSIGNAGSGTGALIRIGNDTGTYHPAEYAGILGGAQISSAALGAGCPALQVGDIVNVSLGDLALTGNASSPGFLGQNRHFWTEQLHGRIIAQSGGGSVPMVQLDVNGGTNSFDRMDLDIMLNQSDGRSSGVAFTGGAGSHSPRLSVKGNVVATAGGTPSVLSFSGATGKGPAGLTNPELYIGVEIDSGTGPQTIKFNDGTNAGFISGGTGLIRFSAFGGSTWTASDNNGNMSFNGAVYGDTALQGKAAKTDYTVVSSGFPAGWTGSVAWRKLADTDLVFVKWAFTIASNTVMGNPTNLATFAAPGFFPGDTAFLTGTLSGGETGYAAGRLTSTGAFSYFGPSLTPSATTFWYGQATFSNSI